MEQFKTLFKPIVKQKETRNHRIIHKEQFCIEGLKFISIASKSCKTRESSQPLKINIQKQRKLSLKTENTEDFNYPIYQPLSHNSMSVKKPSIFNLSFTTAPKPKPCIQRQSVDTKHYTIHFNHNYSVPRTYNQMEMNIFRYRKLQQSPKLKLKKEHYV